MFVLHITFHFWQHKKALYVKRSVYVEENNQLKHFVS